MKTSTGGTGPYIVFRNYGTEGWSAWSRYEATGEAIKDILSGEFCEEVILVREVEVGAMDVLLFSQGEALGNCVLEWCKRSKYIDQSRPVSISTTIAALCDLGAIDAAAVRQLLEATP